MLHWTKIIHVEKITGRYITVSPIGVVVEENMYLEYEVEFVLHGGPWEERPAARHLVEDAADAPHVDGRGVLGGAEQHVRRAVPQRHNLVTVRLGRDRLGSS